MKKWIAVFVVSLALSICGLVVWVSSDITNFSAFVASHCIGRKVTIGRILRTGSSLDITDIHVKNADWATEPDMFYVQHVRMDPDWAALLLGRMTFKQMIIEDANLLLERDAAGVGNWKNRPSQKPPDPQAEGRRDRETFPTILNLAISNSHIAMRTSSGARIKIDLVDISLQTPGPDQPVRLKVNGAYNGLPVKGQIDAQSFDILHDASQSFHGMISAQGRDVSLVLDADFMDPINFDQLNGTMHLDIDKVGAATAYFGGQFNWSKDLLLDGEFARQLDHWQIAGAAGNLAGNKFDHSQIQLDEGARKRPDRIVTELNFDKIDVASLLEDKNQKTTPKLENKASSSNSSDEPPAFLDATVTARDFLGARFETKLTVQEKTTTLDVNLLHLDMQKTLQALYKGSPFLNGFLNINTHLEAGGSNWNAMSETVNGKIEAGMKEAYIARWANHLAATNLRGLFENKKDTLPIECFDAQINFNNGHGVLNPFILKTGEGILHGGGFIDLPEDKMMLAFGTDPKTTSEFSLDVPVQLSGELSDPTLGLAANSNIFSQTSQNCQK